MRRIVTIALCTVFLAILFCNLSFAQDAKSLKGSQMYTRTNLKTHGRVVAFHNMSLTKGFIPAGTLVEIIKVGGAAIKFRVLDSGATYNLKARSDHYDKYFVKDLTEIGLGSMSDQVKEKIALMIVEPGMTKNEVYVSKGNPAYIGYGIKSYVHPLDQVMESDSWYYNLNSRRQEMLVRFEDGVVVEVQQTKKAESKDVKESDDATESNDK